MPELEETGCSVTVTSGSDPLVAFGVGCTHRRTGPGDEARDQLGPVPGDIDLVQVGVCGHPDLERIMERVDGLHSRGGGWPRERCSNVLTTI